MNKIPLIHQAGVLRSYFPDSQTHIRGNTLLTWIGYLRPSPLGRPYKVKMVYSKEKGISVYVLKPKLALAKGCNTLPHTYDDVKQKLCLYYPKEREWHPGMWMAKTILAWASEWLYFYELWLVTDGNWLGGGVNSHCDSKENNNQTNSQNGTE